MGSRSMQRSLSRVLVLGIVGCSGSDSSSLLPSPDAPVVVDAPVVADAPRSPDAAPLPPDAATADAGTTGADGGTTTEIAYVATFLNGLLSFTVDPAVGALVPASAEPFDAGGHLYGIALDPSGRFLYTADPDRNVVLGFRTTPGSGALSPIEHSPFPTQGGAVSIAVDPAGRFVYVGSIDPEKSLSVFKLNDDGSLSPSDQPPIALGGEAASIAADPSGRFVYVVAANGIHLFTVDAAGAALHEVQGSPLVTNVFGGPLLFHPSGKLLFSGKEALRVFLVDPDTGKLEEATDSPVTNDVGSDPQATSLAFDPTGNFVYGVHVATGHVIAYKIDPRDGTLERVAGSPYDANPMPYSVAVDPAGGFLYVGNDDADQITAFKIDAETGALKAVESPPFQVHGLQPEILFLRR